MLSEQEKTRLIETAREMLSLGFNVVAVGRNKDGALKLPLMEWKRYQTETVAIEALEEVIRTKPVLGFSVVCGDTSGGFEVLDIDTKNCESEEAGRELWDAFRARLEEETPELKSKLVAGRTPSGGFHIYYRAPESVTDHLAKTEAGAVLIETKGQGGLSGFPSVPGYRFLNRKTARDVCAITSAERDALHAVARSFNRNEGLKSKAERIIKARSLPSRRSVGSPFDDFNSREDLFKMVKAHGWEFVRSTGDGVRLKKPGKTKNESQGEIKDGGRFLVFSSCHPFEAGKSYTAADVFAIDRGIDPHTDAGRRSLAELLKSEGYGF